MVIRIAILGCMFFLLEICKAQNSTLFLMLELPQSNFVNPAVQSSSKWTVGVPGLSSLQANHHTTISTFNNAFERQNNGVSIFAYDKVINNLEGLELYIEEENYTPFFVGVQLDKGYLSFAVNERFTGIVTLPAVAAQLLWNGNSSRNQASFDEWSVRADHSREYIIGWSYSPSKPLTLGFHSKLLFGKANFYMPNVSASMTTNPSSFDISVDMDATVRSSFPIEIIEDESGYIKNIEYNKNFNRWDYALNRKNVGLAFDAGVIYKLNEKTTMIGSLLNIGAIRWRNQPEGISVNGQYSFSGYSSETVGYFDSVVDSLENALNLVVDKSNYTSFLVPELHLGLTHKVTDDLKLGMAFFSRIMKYKWTPALTLSVNTYDYKNLTGAISYTLLEGSYFNIGAGLGYKWDVFHLHVISDNIIGLISLADSQFINLRFGLTIMLDKKNTPFDCECHERWQGRQKKSTKRIE